jgi:thiamine pyrophosphate-dependent acetolactate synthase large subunit-like protein
VGSFATVASQRPANLAVVVLDNEHYGETGMQRTSTSHGTDLAAMAAGAGIPTVLAITDMAGVDGLTTALTSGPLPLVAVLKIAASKPNLVLPPRDGVYLKNRFRQAVLGSTDAMHAS